MGSRSTSINCSWGPTPTRTIASARRLARLGSRRRPCRPRPGGTEPHTDRRACRATTTCRESLIPTARTPENGELCTHDLNHEGHEGTEGHEETLCALPGPAQPGL